MKPMRTEHSCLRCTPIAQALTEELLGRAGVLPGMRVLVPGGAHGDLAFLVAERVGDSGTVVAIDSDAQALRSARTRARVERFERLEFRAVPLAQARALAPFDAVVARFFLMYEPDPVAALRSAAVLLRPGGRLVAHEWHFESMLWAQTSHWPDLPLYRSFARWSVETLRRSGAHVDVGLRLVNLFAEARLPLPATRTELCAVKSAGARGYGFFEQTMRELLPAMQRFGIAEEQEVAVDSFAHRLERDASAAGGHAFLPLQVGAWTRI